MTTHTCCLILPAAGNGTRFGSDTPKQFLPLAGRLVFLRCLDVFQSHISACVIPTNASGKPIIEEALAQESFPFPIIVCAGGKTRMHSVAAGLEHVPHTCSSILIHDAARPLVTSDCIQACQKSLHTHTACVVALPSHSTVKYAQGTTVKKTINRDHVYFAQTPQGLEYTAGKKAFAQAISENWSCTDDAEVMERAGHQVAIVPGHPHNIKITTPEDWALAENLVDK